MGRSVPVLLCNELIDCVNLILKHREQANVSKNNLYVFGLPGAGPCFNYLRANPLMREYSEKCGAANPSTLRGTQLRKQIATQCVLLNLEDNDVMI